MRFGVYTHCLPLQSPLAFNSLLMRFSIGFTSIEKEDVDFQFSFNEIPEIRLLVLREVKKFFQFSFNEILYVDNFTINTADTTFNSLLMRF